ncbi:hypothetical protein BD779DRAFT_1465949 [Infundibulicybe gibba]|nr:hypothetical protein BD779DRAFT_1465949 [Infundibulicybe gibba]
MSGASIGEPFLLSNYKRSQKVKATDSARGSSHLHASYVRPSGGSSDGCVTVAAQSDGIHISTLHPIISHTLGPSTTFACSPLTLCIPDSGGKTYATYSVITSSPDISSAEGGRTIWSWRENLSDSLADRAAQKMKSVVMPEPIFGLSGCVDLPSRLLIFDLDGGLTITDTELETKCTQPCEADAKILQVFIFSRQDAFLPAQTTSAHGAVVVLLQHLDASRCRVRVLSVSEDLISHVGDCFLPLAPEEIVDVSCSASGCLSVLCKSGSWRTFQISSKNHEPITISAMSEPIHLHGFSFIPTSPDYVSLLALNSSHVFLCGLVKSSTSEIILQIWDLQYSVLLASHTLSIPSTLSQSKDIAIKIKLVPGSMSQAIIVLSPTGPKSTSMHTSVLVVPINIPSTSTIANAIGKASASAKWISTRTGNTDTHSTTQSNLLEAMRAAMVENHPQAANAAFFEWIQNEGVGNSLDGDDKNVNKLVDLDYMLIQTILDIVIQPSKVGNVVYLPDVVRFMLEHRMISGNMLNGGVFTALRLRNDWKSIQLAFASVLDITESEIIDSLKFVINHHRQTSSTAPNDASAMTVDTPTTTPGDQIVPPLPVFLASCVRYSTTPSPLQAAFSRYLHEAEDVLAVLLVLDGWIRNWNKKDAVLLPNKKDVGKNERGVVIIKPRQQNKISPNDPPPLDRILSFLQTLLDSSFLSILQHKPSHQVLKRLSANIQPEIVYIDEVEQLRGSLEPFSRAQAKAIKEGSEEKKKGPVGDWRLRKKLAHEQAGIEVGLYRLEELVFWVASKTSVIDSSTAHQVPSEMTSIRVAVLTVSDTASLDAKADKSGPAIREILEARGLSCVQYTIVPDDILRIQNTVVGWCKQGDVDWIITTGGTGFGERDITPEAVSVLLERNASGLIHLLLSTSLKHTPMAALSRPVAGTIGRTLITTLPGSLKAVKENIVPLLAGGLVDHAIELIRGGSGRGVHDKLAATTPAATTSDTADTHPSSGPEHHHHHHHEHHGHHAPKPRSVLSHDPQQQVDTSLRGHILASDIHAPHDVPLCATTNVVTPQTHSISTILPEGKIYRINTGAPLPAGADAVIMVEDTRLVSTFLSADGAGGEEKEVLTAAQVPAGENVEVYRKPVVALLSTGNEIVDLHSTKPQPGENGVEYLIPTTLIASRFGGSSVNSHVEAIKKGLDSSDILLTTGGTSMGPADLLKPVIEREFNGTIHFGRVPSNQGNPQHLLLFRSRLGGWPVESCHLPRVRVKLRSSMRLDTRTEFHRVCIRATEEGLEAFSTGGQRSSRVASLSGANGLIQLPPSKPGGPTAIESGTVVEALVIGELAM